MVALKKLKELSFLVYGLGLTGQSVVKFFNRNKIKNYSVWDDFNKNLYQKKRSKNLKKSFELADYIVLSPGINLNKSKYKIFLKKFKKKIITDIDLIYLLKKFKKSVVVTGTNGKSTTCKILDHLLQKNGYKALLGGNIGTPILNHKIKKDNFLIIEASSFQLNYSKFISPDYALLLNITNDHLDWHGSMRNYIQSKFKIFQNQKKNQYSLINKNFSSLFKSKNFQGKLVIPKFQKYKKLKSKIKNSYLSSDINDENMLFVYCLSKLLKIKERSLIKTLRDFKGLPHRYEIFMKKKNCTFINDSKATSFQATKFALKNTKNIFWILGGLPKTNDQFFLKDIKKNIIMSYIIGNHKNFFKRQLKNQVKIRISNNLKNALNQAVKDVKILNKENSTILFSPSSASFDQFLNFERRGEEFKRLSKYYARKLI